MPESTSLYQTIVFADIAGSTQLYENLGDARACDLVSKCLEEIARIARWHQGRVVKTVGDEVLCRFDEPDLAARAAIDMQETVAGDPDLSAAGVKLHIGLNYGAVIEEANDLYGDVVNVAAHMVGQAKAGQIITTKYSLDMMSADIGNAARMVDQAQIKGKQAAIAIFEIPWGQPEEITVVGTHSREMIDNPSVRDALLILDLQDQHVSVNYEQPVITMGRDASNRIVVNHPKVSRLHARVELCKGHFNITDQSTNGTYICPTNSDTVILRRDEDRLEGDGIIYLGKEAKPDAPHAIHYHVI